MNQLLFWFSIVQLFLCGFYFGYLFGDRNEKKREKNEK
jgi:hypothetical protein